jgi:hypothetical protein
METKCPHFNIQIVRRDQNLAPSFKSVIHQMLWSMDWSWPKMQGTLPTPRAGHAGVTIGENWYIVGGGDNKSLMIIENGRREYARAIYGENDVMSYLSWNRINFHYFMHQVRVLTIRSNNPKIPHTGAQLQLQICSSGRGWSKLQFGKQTYHTGVHFNSQIA